MHLRGLGCRSLDARARRSTICGASVPRSRRCAGPGEVAAGSTAIVAALASDGSELMLEEQQWFSRPVSPAAQGWTVLTGLRHYKVSVWECPVGPALPGSSAEQLRSSVSSETFVDAVHRLLQPDCARDRSRKSLRQ